MGKDSAKDKVKDEAAVTGSEYADADPNPAFHGEEVPANSGKDPEPKEQTAYQP